MRLLIATALTFFLLAAPAQAAMAMLVTCEYRYVMDYGKAMYVGIYKSTLSGDLYKFYFDSYCPVTTEIR